MSNCFNNGNPVTGTRIHSYEFCACYLSFFSWLDAWKASDTAISRWKRKSLFILVPVFFLILLLAVPTYADTPRSFPQPSGSVTDLTSTLTPDQIQSIEQSVKNSTDSTNMDGMVIVTSSTDDWYLNEYLKDYGDWLQSQGLITRDGWLIYISTTDRKFGLVAQDGALASLTPIRRREIELIIGERLGANDLNGAITKAVNSIKSLPAIKKTSNGTKKPAPSSTLIFTGLAIILFTLVLRSRKQASAMAKR
jgi:uncharacterized membrane protein YgcG